MWIFKYFPPVGWWVVDRTNREGLWENEWQPPRSLAPSYVTWLHHWTCGADDKQRRYQPFFRDHEFSRLWKGHYFRRKLHGRTVQVAIIWTCMVWRERNRFLATVWDCNIKMSVKVYLHCKWQVGGGRRLGAGVRGRWRTWLGVALMKSVCQELDALLFNIKMKRDGEFEKIFQTWYYVLYIYPPPPDTSELAGFSFHTKHTKRVNV